MRAADKLLGITEKESYNLFNFFPDVNPDNPKYLPQVIKNTRKWLRGYNVPRAKIDKYFPATK